MIQALPERLARPRGFFVSFVVGLSVLYGFTLFFGLNRHPLPGFDDAIYAHEAKDLLNRNAFWEVRFNGYPRHENPPLLDWLLLTSFRVVGVSDQAARLPAALAAWIMFWVLLGVCRELEMNRNSTLMTLLVFAGSGYLIQYARRSMTDVPFACLILLAVLLLLKSRRQRHLLPVAFLVAGTGGLLKSVFALLFLPFALLLLVSHSNKWSLKWPLILFSLFFFLLPFSLWILALFPDHGWSSLGVSFISSKFAGEVEPFHYMTSLWGRYQPWYLFWILGILLNIRRIHQFRSSLLILWTLSFFLPLSFAAAKVTRYLLAIFPAMALTVVSPAFESLTRDRQKLLLLAVSVLYLGTVGLFFMRTDLLDQPVDDSMRRLALVPGSLPLGSAVELSSAGGWSLRQSKIRR